MNVFTHREQGLPQCNEQRAPVKHGDVVAPPFAAVLELVEVSGECELVGSLLLVAFLSVGPHVSEVVSDPEGRAQDAGEPRLGHHVVRECAREGLEQRAVVPCEPNAAKAWSLEQEELDSEAVSVSARRRCARDNSRTYQLMDLAPLVGVETLERDVRRCCQ